MRNFGCGFKGLAFCGLRLIWLGLIFQLLVRLGYLLGGGLEVGVLIGRLLLLLGLMLSLLGFCILVL